MKKDELLPLFHKVGDLKKIKRTGWVRHGIPESESVADHTFRTTLMAMTMGDILEVDSFKLIKMALIHDLAEAIAGDITPHDGISREEKQRIEEMGLKQLLKDVPNGQAFLELWVEYEEQNSREAIILKNIDKLEMALQAGEYQKAFPDKDLSEFILEAHRQINIPEMRGLLEEVRREINSDGCSFL
jgi:5'-deoxynucleotidase YfbR-like HD superfamily hydrolase